MFECIVFDAKQRKTTALISIYSLKEEYQKIRISLLSYQEAVQCNQIYPWASSKRKVFLMSGH